MLPMRRRKRWIFICLVLVVMYCCWTILGHTHRFLPITFLKRTPITDDRHGCSTLQAVNNITISPPLGKDESPHNINYNIERRFTIDCKEEEHRKPIPKYIHFIWNNETVPVQFVNNLKSFLIHNPDWDYYFWTFKTGRLLIQEHHPGLLLTFDRYQLDVMRADALRYVIMYHFGGAYFDLDTHNLKPLDTIIKGEQCIITPEPMEHAVFVLQIRSFLSNGVFLCSPKHTFFKMLIERLLSTSSYTSLLQATGPLYFTESFKEYIVFNCLAHSRNRSTEEIRVISYSVFLDRIKEQVQTTLDEKCPKYITYTQTFYSALSCDRLTDEQRRSDNAAAVCKEMQYYRLCIDACDTWVARGGRTRAISSRAVNDHTYYSTYERPNSLTFIQHNHIRNIIPRVRIYRDINPHTTKLTQ